MLFCQHPEEDPQQGAIKLMQQKIISFTCEIHVHCYKQFFSLLSTNCWNKFQITNLI